MSDPAVICIPNTLDKVSDSDLFEAIHALNDEVARREALKILDLVKVKVNDENEDRTASPAVKVYFTTMEYDNGYFFTTDTVTCENVDGSISWAEIDDEDKALSEAVTDWAGATMNLGPSDVLLVDLAASSVGEHMGIIPSERGPQ